MPFDMNTGYNGQTMAGQTRPTAEEGSFKLEVFARNIDTGKLHSVCRTEIKGGQQWLPFHAPHNSIAVDYLCFRGDFENLSVMVRA